MVNQELINWIKGQQREGHNLKQIADYLIRQGYNQNDVEQAINIASNQNVQNNVPSETKPKNHLLIIIVSVVVLCLICGGIFFLIHKDSFDNSKVNIKVNLNQDNTSKKVTVSTSSVPNKGCTFSSDCSGGLYCLEGVCTTIDDFFTNHVACCEEGMLVGGVSECDLVKQHTERIESCSQFPCKNCEKETQVCVSSNNDNIFVAYCSECLNRFDCKTGFICDKGRCVSG